VKRTETEIVVKQFNPPRTFTIDCRTVLHIYRILTLVELMGVGSSRSTKAGVG
jgi:hypothetical protein